ncbi:glutamyl-tRNA reductase [Chengkuizengella sp. SCS-71B]|uniref:glutamyl-tRNA reductase n=1 Tax=Chengkuizengella sp. SCS-71B TaxID=3115290 RepID=UPI0032C24439
MHIVVVGLNYRTAPVDIREKFAISEEQTPIALRMLKNTKSILECVMVATCNRTEIYAVVDRLHLCGHYIRSFMQNWFGVSREEFAKHLYVYEDEGAIEHLFKVTCGLDSMIIGETQILGQVKDAFLLAQSEKTTGTLFNHLFKQGITMAKRAHSETTIGENAVSVSYAAVELGKQIFGDFRNKTVMIIGAGKMSELTVKHLHANGVKKVIVVNRTISKAKKLAQQFNGIACSFDGFHKYISETNIIISSTGSSDLILTKGQVENLMSTRKTSSPLFMIDIAVPRDLDPDIIDIPNVFLYDIDDLEGIVQNNMEQRKQEAEKIEKMIIQEIAVFENWYNTLGLGPVIQALQEKAADIHAETMESLLNKLPDLDEREIKVIRKLSKSIANQVLHDPIQRIKEMAGDRKGDAAIQLFSHLFALEEKLEQNKEIVRLNHLEEKKQKAAEEKAKILSLHKHKLAARP